MQQSKFTKISVGLVVILLVGFLGYYFLKPSENKKVVGVSTQKTIPVKRTLSESPLLSEKVKNSELPSIDDRVPHNPLIVVPLEKIGVYGGTWHLVAKSKSDHNSFLRNIGYENLLRWNVNWTDIIPNIAQSYDVNTNGTEYIFHLRDGMKWSDGEPFTADDIIFWYEDVFMNKDLTPVHQTWLTSNGKPVSVSKIDSSTVKFSFTEPNGLFLQNLAQPKGGEITSYPKHYLSQFLPKYNPTVDSLVKANKSKDWKDLFISQFGNIGTPDDQTRWQHPKVPTLNTWILVNEYGKDPEIKAVRNPYYWKIDPAGNQLPYIDELVYTITDDSKVINSLAVLGKLDMQDRNVGNSMLSIASSRKSIEDGAKDGGYRLFKTVFATMNTMMISFNLNHKDPVVRKIFQDKNFRIGMSHAVDRQKIIDILYGGRGAPYQGAPRPESPFYDEEMAKQYTEYDTVKANKYLDDASLSKKDSAGYRLRPDGKRLSVVVDWGDPKALEIIKQNWKDVGVEMNIGNTTDRTTYYKKKANKDVDVSVWTGDGGIDVIQEPRYYFPFGDTNESNYALGWGYWFSNPNNPLAEEPPQIVKDQMSLYKDISGTVDTKKQNELMKKILVIAKDQFYALGISLPVDGFGVVKNNFHNVPEAMTAAFTYPNPAPTNPCQYFIQ